MREKARALCISINLILISASCPQVCAADQAERSKDVIEAVQSGLRVLQSGTINYAKEQNCFTCHHQTLPMLAQATARRHGFEINESLLQQQARFTHEAFADRTDTLRKGGGIGGRSMTVAYALWALDLARWKPDETTEAMASYLLKTQEEDGRFFTNASRPPLEDSPATSATIGAYYLDKYAAESERTAAAAGAAKATAWLLKFEPVRQEDRNSRLWGAHLLHADEQEIASARQAVLETQHPSGGWVQLPGMEPDSYATGQALWMLQETGFPTTDPAYQRGVRYLLDTQLEDGSWLVKTRSRAIQKYFESGFPHGKDQFISVCGTSWAVAALAATQPRATSP